MYLPVVSMPNLDLIFIFTKGNRTDPNRASEFMNVKIYWFFEEEIMTISDVVYQHQEILHYLDDVTKQDLMEAWKLNFDATFASNMVQLECEWECVPLSSE